MGIDLNGDNLDDEILITKKLSSPNLIIVIGIYNMASKMYVRVAEIQTEVSQFRSFSYNGVDVTGEHRLLLFIRDLQITETLFFRCISVMGELKIFLFRK